MLGARYANAETLMWRNGEALVATMCMVAMALELWAVVVGHTGEEVVRRAGLPAVYAGTGDVHVG